jgi:hypothetical protein
MTTAYEYLSLKKITLSTIDSRIAEKQDYIKSKLTDIFTDASTAKVVGEHLIDLASLKDAKLIMSTPNYSAYEETGKVLSYESFLSTISN